MSKRNLLAALALTVACGGVTEGTEDAPRIASLDPVNGSSEGGTVVTVTGSGFDSTFDHYAVIGGRVVADVTVVDGATVTFPSPPGSPGPADVTVVSFGGSDTLLAGYTYNEAPEVLTIDRELALGSGGGTLTVRGVGFANNVVGDTTVLVGAAPAASVTVVNDSTITAVLGPRDAGDPGFTPLDVSVVNDNGTGTLEASLKYTQPGLVVTNQNGSFSLIDVQQGFLPLSFAATAGARKVALLPDGNVVGRSINNRVIAIDPFSGIAGDGPQINGQVQSLTTDALGTIFVYQGQRLGTLNPSTGVIAPIGAANPGAATQHICIADRNPTSVFYMSDAADGLQSMSKANSSLALIRALTGLPTVQGNVFCKSLAIFDGELYAVFYDRNVDNETMIVVHINVSTGQVTEIDRRGERIRSMFQTPPGY